jgi:2-polyprenyl-3-methyl-5-hydroxy-6-metoxy-1,4-benzoquinol methylase
VFGVTADQYTMRTADPIVDRSRDMDETSWWDLWNKTHRTKEDNDPVSSELFTRTAAVINEIAQREPCRVLEIGCGAGSLSRLLTYSSYHGLDISPAAIDLARQKSEFVPRPVGASCPTYEAADFHDWAPPSHLFDLAVCVDAVAYFRDQRFAMNKIAQCLRPSGQLVLTTINPFVYHRIRRTQTKPLAEGPVSHWLTCSELHALIESAGFRVEQSWTIMPRGNCGILRLINSRTVNEAFGPRCAAMFRRLKERVGLGQYRIVVARKRR